MRWKYLNIKEINPGAGVGYRHGAPLPLGEMRNWISKLPWGAAQ
jgi:hypothetical protein